MLERLLISVVLCFLLTFNAHSSSNDWLAEEVLSQLAEMRKEINSLNAEVTYLRDELSRLKQEGISQGGEGSADSLDIKGTPFVGDESASYAIVEFTDFQCPYCQRHFKNTFPLIEKNYVETGKIKYIAKQFPLDFHGQAKNASIAALCLEEQKKGLYWQAHSDLFGGVVPINYRGFVQLANQYGLDEEVFSTCLSNPVNSHRVDQEIQQGQSIGVQGTPAFLIGKIEDGKIVNGRLLSGARQYQRFASLIERAMQE